MNLFKTLFIFLFCLSVTGLSAQKQQLKKANEYYKLNQYKDAINLYEEALEVKDNLAATTKLAYCYRMTNQMVAAEKWYAKVVENEKAKPITYFYYAESLMSNGKYDLAKNWFLKYNEEEPNDKNAIRMAYACDKVKTLEPYFKNVSFEAFQHNTAVDDNSPLYFKDGIVFTSDRPTGPNPLKKKSGWTGRDYQRIYFSELESDGSYGNPENFSKKLNDLNKHCGPVSFTKDERTVIFTRTGQMAGKGNSYNIQLYSAESEDGRKWKNATLLPFCSKENNYMHPAISPDGSKLFFVSDKPGGLGGTDIYMCKKKGDGWDRPQNLGPIINTAANEAFPFFHASEKLFFCSKGHLSYGGFDILFSNEKEDGSWQKPVNVGKPINSSYDDISIFLDEEMNSGLFASSRDGGDDDIYTFKIMEGINADLESLDFEDLAVNEKEQPEEMEMQMEHPIIPDPVATEPMENTIVEKQPLKNLEGTIRKNETLEEIREEQIVATAPEPPKVEVLIIEEKKRTAPTAEIISNQSEIGSLEKQMEIINPPPMEKIIKVEEEVMVDVAPQKSMPLELETKTEVQKKKTSKKETSKVKKEEDSQAVNLFIPSKKKKRINQAKEEEDFEPAMIIEEETRTAPEPAVQEVIVMEEETIVEIPTTETEIVDTPPTPKQDTPAEKISILDMEPMESEPPVMLGDETSMLADNVQELARLAELLQANQPIPNQGFKIKGLTYSTGSFLLSPDDTRSLSAVIDLMSSHPNLKIEIGSHTSSLGNDVANHNLSRKRAKSIKAFLVYKGISNDRITAKGYGETQLTNECTNGMTCPQSEHEKNNRVEVKVIH